MGKGVRFQIELSARDRWQLEEVLRGGDPTRNRWCCKRTRGLRFPCDRTRSRAAPAAQRAMFAVAFFSTVQRRRFTWGLPRVRIKHSTISRFYCDVPRRGLNESLCMARPPQRPFCQSKSRPEAASRKCWTQSTLDRVSSSSRYWEAPRVLDSRCIHMFAAQTTPVFQLRERFGLAHRLH